MDFEQIDTVHADTLEPGDIIKDDDEFFVVEGWAEDSDGVFIISVECLTDTEGDDTILTYNYVTFDLYRSI